jgi:hypothetical protein
VRPPYRGLRKGVPNPVVLGRKFCSRCGRWRPAHDFALRPVGKLTVWCTTCQRVSNRAALKRKTPEQRELRREYERIWYEVQRRRQGIPARPRLRPSAGGRVFLPREPLVQVMEWFVLVQRANGHPDFGWRTFAEMVGRDEHSLFRLRTGESRRVTQDLADRIAVAMNIPLSMIYPPE